MNNKTINKKDKFKIAVVCRTIGLEYDDRIRKECITLSKKADIKIFANHVNNITIKGMTSYKIPYQTFTLYTRNIFPSAKFIFLKAIEFYIQIKKHLKNYDIIWAHEEYAFLFALLPVNKTIIWDHHEIPFRFEKPLLKNIFQLIEKKCKKMIHANEYRIEYLLGKRLITDISKHITIRNFPDKYFIQSETTDEQYDIFKKWLNGSKYAYLQGISKKERHPLNSVMSILESTELKIIIIGDLDHNTKFILQKKFGNEFHKRVYLRGMINQLNIPQYIKDSLFSIVLYDAVKPNNMYCEPNRMYQALSLEIPVIVGNNPPMAELIKKYAIGVVLNDDGRDIEELKLGINKLLKNRTLYVNNIKYCKNNIIWNAQENKLISLIGKS